MYTGDCPSLHNPANGFMLDTEFSYGQDVRFKCDEGFAIQGSATIRCDLNRDPKSGDVEKVRWNASVPQCVGKSL